MNLRLHRAAVDEIDHEVDYYESKQSGLGAELEDEIDDALDTIVRFPEVGALWKHRTDRRVFVLARFPFTLPYQIVHTEIVVLALAHASRRPGYWARRR
jgi:plasmid stabilization system protein ParE